MKFEAQLTYVTGYLRSGKLVGELTQEQLNEWKMLPERDQQEYLFELGTVKVTDWRINDIGDIYEVEWNEE